MKVAFIGHRNIERTQELRECLTQTVESLIVNENADIFLFGSRSAFNDLCYEIVTELQNKYGHIKRIYVRAEYEYIKKEYIDYLSSLYEDTFFPIEVHGAGVLSYIKRNRVMIDMCDVLVAYCNQDYAPPTRVRSGTKTAVEYARSKHKRIINLFAICR